MLHSGGNVRFVVLFCQSLFITNDKSAARCSSILTFPGVTGCCDSNFSWPRHFFSLAGSLVFITKDKSAVSADACSGTICGFGAPGRTRTCNPRLRRPVLYPVELRALHKNWSGWRDSNSRPTAPKAVALPGCATPRQGFQPGNVTDLDRIRQRLISKKNPVSHGVFQLLARPERFELPTFWFVARHSIQLSYGRINTCYERLLRGQRIILLKRNNVNSRDSLSLLQ